MSTETKVAHQQEVILQMLKVHSDDRGYVKGVDLEMLARMTGVSLHDVAKSLWGMQKRGIVGFSEKKGTGGHSIPYRFRLKKAGFEISPEEVQAIEPLEDPAVESNRRAREIVGLQVDTKQDEDGIERPVKRPPKRKNPIEAMLHKESDLRFCADLLMDYGLEELSLQVIEHVRLSNEELKALQEFFEVTG